MKAVLVLHTSRQLKEDNGKQNAERYGVRKGSPVGNSSSIRYTLYKEIIYTVLC